MSSRRSGLFAGFVIAVAAACWLVLGGDAVLPEASPAGSPETATAGGAGIELRTTEPDGEVRALAADAARGTGRDEIMPSTLIHLVAVLPDGQPAAGAEVLFWPPRSQAQRDRDEQATEGMRDAELAVRGRGRGARTDQDGTAAIEIDEETPICVRHGDHLGETSFDNECGPGPLWCRVELQRDVALRVQVVDESGAPCVGNEVNCWTVARTLAFRGPTCILDLGCTDADGMVVLPHVQLHMPVPGEAAPSWSCFVYVDPNRAPDVPRRVTWAELHAPEPVRIVLPRGGTVLAVCRDADGQPVNPNLLLEQADGGRNIHTSSVDYERGLARFDHVPLGGRWKLHVGTRGGRCAMHCVGPVRTGEEVRVEVSLPEREVQLVARLVQPDGSPLEGAEVTFHSRFLPGGQASNHSCAEGVVNLRTALPASSPDIGDLQLEIAHRLMRQPYRLAVGRRLSPGRNDLGDLLVPVQPAETLLAVVDVRAGGLPLRIDPNAVRIGVRTDQRFQTGATTWRRVGDLLHLHGEPPAPEFLVLIVVDGFVPAEVACRPGARVAFDLRPAAQLVVAVGRRNVPNDWVEADLVPTPGGGEPRPSCLGWDHFLRWRGLEPGRYRLRLNVLDRVVLESDAFELRPGWNSWPPGGTLVDLPPGERVVRLDVLPEEVPGEGSSVDSTWTVVPAGAQELPPGPREWTPSEDGWFRVRQAPADLLITAECFVPVRTSAPIQDTVIRLRRRTLLAVSVDSAEPVELLCKVVEDGVRDPLLLRLDKGNPRDVEFTEVCDEPLELHYAPGTVLEFTVVRSGVTGPPQRVFVGPGPRQEVRVAAPVAAVPPERRR